MWPLEMGLVHCGGSSSPVRRTLQSPPFIKGDRGGFVDGPSIQNPPCPPLEKGEIEFRRRLLYFRRAVLGISEKRSQNEVNPNSPMATPAHLRNQSPPS